MEEMESENEDSEDEIYEEELEDGPGMDEDFIEGIEDELDGLDMNGSSFEEGDFDEADFEEEDLEGEDFDEADFEEEDLEGEDFDEGDFEEEDFDEEEIEDEDDTEELEIEEPSEEEIQARIKKSKGGVPFDTGFVVTGRYDLSATSEIGLKAGLTEEQKKLFSYFVPVRGMSEQIVEVLDNDRRAQREGTSKTGNLLVIGRKGSGKTVLAVDIVKAIQKQRNLKQGKVAIVTGESLNKKELTNIIQKLRGGAIIIEHAGKLNSRTVKELNYLMEKKTGELLFVLEDQRKPLERLMTANPEFKKKFSSKLELPVFINDELVTFGQTYAKENGYKLDEMGIQHTCFFEVAPDPTLQCAQKGVDQMRAFEPDTIIALGGGSAMDAAKIMWVMYEHPEANFEDMAMDFMDIRKRVFTFPKMGEKAYFVAIPTSSGTGSEVTPFAIITDAETGVKWPIADYALLPNMAIVDVDNMMTQPKGLTSASGIDVMTHAIEAYVSIMATDYTDGLAMKAVKMVFENLPSAYDNGANDPKAREEMANASCMAGMAFANAFLGLNHSMAHKLGAFHHLPHGVANAVILTEVMRYNAAEVPTKMGTFSQYQYPHALARYAELGRFAGCTGNTDAEVFENFLAKLEVLKDKIGIKKTIKDYGVDEKYFLDTLDDMVEQAFNDQCTGANPRYPLMKEMKEIYLKCYYGK